MRHRGRAAADLFVFEIRGLFQQNLQVTGLVQIKLGRQQRPKGMVHPDTGDIVAVSYKFALLFADDGRIRTVQPDACIVIHDHLPDTRGVHNEQRKTVLPEVTPAASTLAVIVIRQEGTAVDSAQDGLETDPTQVVVLFTAAGLKRNIDLLLPVLFHFDKDRFCLFGSVTGRQDLRKRCFVPGHAEAHHILHRLTGSKNDRCKFHAAHSLFAMDLGAGSHTLHCMVGSLRIQEGAAFSQKSLNGRINDGGQLSVCTIAAAK